MLRISHEALTFDDVLLVPGYSNVTAKDVTTYSQLTRGINYEHSAGVGCYGYGY